MIGSLLVVLLSTVLSLSEPAPSVHQAAQGVPEARGPNRDPGELSPAEVVGMLDAYALVQAQNALQLNDSQYGSFVGRLKTLQETRRKNQRARNQIAVREPLKLSGVRFKAIPLKAVCLGLSTPASGLNHALFVERFLIARVYA